MSWKTIDSAPKDGTHILMCREGEIKEAWWTEDFRGEEMWGGYGWDYPEWSQPTHWMPKPPPPETLTLLAADAVKPCSKYTQSPVDISCVYCGHEPTAHR